MRPRKSLFVKRTLPRPLNPHQNHRFHLRLNASASSWFEVYSWVWVPHPRFSEGGDFDFASLASPAFPTSVAASHAAPPPLPTHTSAPSSPAHTAASARRGSYPRAPQTPAETSTARQKSPAAARRTSASPRSPAAPPRTPLPCARKATARHAAAALDTSRHPPQCHHS